MKKMLNIINNHLVYSMSMTMLILLGGYLIYTNYSYSRQIEENNKIIDDLMLNASLTKDLIEEHVDSTGKFFVIKYLINKETNKPITYNQLDSMYEEYRDKAQIYEILLLRAKKVYQFDYSYKIDGDTIGIAIWPKSQTKLIKINPFTQDSINYNSTPNL